MIFRGTYLLQSLQCTLANVGAAVGTFELNAVRDPVGFLNGSFQRICNSSGAGDTAAGSDQLAVLESAAGTKV